MTFYTVFVIDLATRRVQVLGITAHPDETFMCQVVRTLTIADGHTCRVWVCDRDAKWSTVVRERLEEAGVSVVQTPYQASNANAYAERFVRSISEECLDRIIPIGEGHFRRAVSEFVAHYHRERNHQGLKNALIEDARLVGAGRVQRQSRLGGLLNFYRRAVDQPLIASAERWDRTSLRTHSVVNCRCNSVTLLRKRRPARRFTTGSGVSKQQRSKRRFKGCLSWLVTANSRHDIDVLL